MDGLIFYWYGRSVETPLYPHAEKIVALVLFFVSVAMRFEWGSSHELHGFIVVASLLKYLADLSVLSTCIWAFLIFPFLRPVFDRLSVFPVERLTDQFFEDLQMENIFHAYAELNSWIDVVRRFRGEKGLSLAEEKKMVLESTVGLAAITSRQTKTDQKAVERSPDKPGGSSPFPRVNSSAASSTTPPPRVSRGRSSSVKGGRKNS